jgi:hypothetical protein
MYGICINLLKPTGYVMYHQFNIQQLYALPTLYSSFLLLYAIYTVRALLPAIIRNLYSA